MILPPRASLTMLGIRQHDDALGAIRGRWRATGAPLGWHGPPAAGADMKKIGRKKRCRRGARC